MEVDAQQLAKKNGIPVETVEEIVKSFQEFDLDKNGYITATELGEVLKSVGLDLPGYKVRELIKKIDRDNDGKINTQEFCAMYLDIKSKDVANTFKKALSKKEGIAAMAGTSHTSAEGTTHSVAEAEKVAFANFINSRLLGDPEVKNYLPINDDTDDIFKKIGDGILLCKMINASAKDTIDERAINKKLNTYTKRENLTLALNSARSIGCNIINIGAADLEQGTPHLVLGLLWQIIRVGLFAKIDLRQVPGLIRLLREGEDINALLSLTPEELLIRWVNYHMEQADCNRRITNFGGDIKDSEVYIVLLKQIAPADIELNHVDINASPIAKAEAMLDNAEKMECRQFVTAQDVVNGNQKLNMAFVANLFNTYPALEDVEAPPEVEETREEKTFRNWMNSLGVNPHVNRLFSDLCNGLVLLQLIDIVKGSGLVDWKRVNNKDKLSKPGGNMKKVENCNYSVELCKSMKFSLVGIGGNDIYDGNETLTLAVVWQMMRAYTLNLLEKISASLGGVPITDGNIVDEVNKKLEEAGKASRITSFKDPSIAKSKVILELVDAIRDKSVNWANYNDAASTDEELLANAKYGLSMARKIGAPVYALPEDIVEVKQKMVMTVFACLLAVCRVEDS